MRLPRRAFDFYLDASIHVAFAIFSLVGCTCALLNIPWNSHLSYFLFFGSISCYNFIKYGVEAEKYIKVANSYHRGIQYFSFLCLIGALYHAFYLDRAIWWGVSGLVCLTGLYALPVLPGAKNLRSLGGLKIFLVAVVWAGATVWLPVLGAKTPWSWDIGVETTQRFVLVLALLLPFEIRDLRYDSPSLRTLPQRFGIPKVKFFGLVLVGVFCLLPFLKDSLTNLELSINGIVAIVLGLYIWKTKENQSAYYASFWVESVPIMWWLLILGCKYLTFFPEVLASF